MSAPSRKLVLAVTVGLALVLVVIGVILWNNTPPPRVHSYETSVKPERAAPERSSSPSNSVDYGAPVAVGDGSLFEGGGRTVTSLPGKFQPVASKPGELVSPVAVAAAVVPEDRQKALVQIDELKLMFRDYRTVMGENPVGTNAEIMKAVTGGNPRGATLGPPEGQTLNPEGELVDRWGSPYFFHQLSANQMEVRSAGPDKKLWTEDDLVQ